jgi:S-layer homology domain
LDATATPQDMTNPLPPDPQSRRDRDEVIAIVVAFAAIGSILAWGLTRGNEGFDLLNTPLLPGLTSASPEATATPLVDPLAPSPTASAAAPAISAEQPDGEDRTRILIEDEDGRLIDPTEPSGAIVPVPVPNGDRDISTSDTTGARVAPASPGPADVTPSPDAAVAFPDVPSDYWAYPFITELSERGILAGTEDGTFQPDQPLTRAEYAALLQKLNNPERVSSLAFNDIPANYWAAPAIDEAIKTGFMRGYPGNVFQPTQRIPRHQVLISLVNGYGLSNPTNPEPIVQKYSDRAEIPNYSVQSVAAATEAGLVVNYPNLNQLEPTRPITRAEVAAIVYQALVATDQAEPIQSQYIVQP